jgi:NHS family xanthosine MFS transporter
MNIKFRLILMNFMQFFVWGAWLLTIGAYCSQTKHWSFSQFGAIFSTMGFSSIIMPALTGIISDKFINAEKLYGILHILGAVVLFCVPMVSNPTTFFWIMLLNMCFYMPTLSLSITVSYSALKRHHIDVVKDFPPIRIWGTIGFIVALWTVSITHNETSANQFYIASAIALTLGLYSFTLPKCPPLLNKISDKSFASSLGLNAFTLFKTPKFAICC